MADTLAKFKATPWGIDFAAPEGTVAEKLRKLTAIQARLIEAANAEKPDAKRFKAFYNPRFFASGHALATLRKTLPDRGIGPNGMPMPKYDRWAVRKTPGYAADFAAVDLGKTFRGAVKALEPPDPYEDFSAPNYTELDPNGRYAIGNGGGTNSKITVTGLTRNETAYIYKDFGAAHFGAFDHKLQAKTTAHEGGTPSTLLWAISNVVNQRKYWYDNDSEALQAYFWMERSLAKTRISVWDTEDDDNDTFNLAGGVVYYITISRDGAAFALYIRITSHSGALQDTLLLSPVAARTYRYLFGVNSYNDANGAAMSYYVQDLDLQEAAALAFFPYHVRSNKKFHNSLILR